MSIKILLIFLTFNNICLSQVPDLTNWKIYSLPTSEELYNAKDYVNWRFSQSGGKWKIVKNDFNHDRGDSLPIKNGYVHTDLNLEKWYRYVKKIPEGYLVGVFKYDLNGLYFIKSDGLSGYKMKGFLMINQIFEYNGKYYALEGYAQAHELSQKGQILEIYKDGNLWKYKTIAKMKDSPELLTDYKNGKVVLTHRSVLIFGKDIKPREVLKFPFFLGTLGPFSLLTNDNDLYIAMAKGVLKIKSFETRPVYEWYVPK